MVKYNEEILSNDPPITADNGFGALHIPIEQLENQLDSFNWSTKNYQWQLFKDGYANHSVAASIELVINYKKDGETTSRTFVGACNFSVQSLNGITDWNATAKSLCIKNAASDIGKWFGRGINKEILPDRSEIKKDTVSVVKKKPDSKIMKQFMSAIEKGDEATITMLSNIYEIKIG